MQHDRRVAAGDRHPGRRRLQPPEEVGQKIQTRATDFFYWGYVEPIDSIGVFKARYRSDAEFAGTGYADPGVDALIDQIEGQMVTYVRDGLIEQVWRKVLGDIVYIPLYRPINPWALRADLELPIALILGQPEFRDARYTTPGRIRADKLWERLSRALPPRR
jgi:hypothetical protein